MEQPLVSVGLPVYNRPEGLRRTLECFINQTYTNIEIIIADNCSPNPEVEKIAREYLEKDQRISYYRHNENKGWGYNTVFVIEKANGDYFMRATDDDWWDCSYIEKVFSLFKKDTIASMSNFEEVDTNGNKSKVHIPNHLPLLLQFTTPDSFVNLKNYINQFEGFGKAIIYGAIIRTEYLRSETVRELMLSEFLAGDMLINLYLLLRGRLEVYPEVLFKCTYNNERFYNTDKPESKKNDFGLFIVDSGIIKNILRKWKKYFIEQKIIISNSNLRFFEKIKLNYYINRRLLLFYYDTIFYGIDFRIFNISKFFRRKYILI